MRQHQRQSSASVNGPRAVSTGRPAARPPAGPRCGPGSGAAARTRPDRPARPSGTRGAAPAQRGRGRRHVGTSVQRSPGCATQAGRSTATRGTATCARVRLHPRGEGMGGVDQRVHPLRGADRPPGRPRRRTRRRATGSAAAPARGCGRRSDSTGANRASPASARAIAEASVVPPRISTRMRRLWHDRALARHRGHRRGRAPAARRPRRRRGAGLVVGGRRHLALADPAIRASGWPGPARWTTPTPPSSPAAGSRWPCWRPATRSASASARRWPRWCRRRRSVCHPAPSAFALARARLGWARRTCRAVGLRPAAGGDRRRILQPGARLLVLSAGCRHPGRARRPAGDAGSAHPG